MAWGDVRDLWLTPHRAGGSSLFVRTGMWEVQIRKLKCCVGRHQFGELRQVWGTMSCHTAESLGSCPHHSLGVTTSVAPEPGRWHLKVLGENYSAGNCIIFVLCLGITLIP